jgi:serine/threonine protein kinase
MKKYKVEQDVKIKILPDKELNTDYAPPIVPDRKPNPIPEPDKKSENNTRKPRNNSCVSMVNEFLGVGGFSKVYRFKKEKDKAVKKIMSNPLIYSTKLTILDSVKREVFGMVKCACKHTIKLYDVFQNQAADTFFLLMELCEGNLEHLMTKLGRPFNTLEIKEILNQLNEVFYKLYINNIIHRDIKPTNILYVEEKNSDNTYNKNLFGGKNYTFKITDFGVCLPLYNTQYSISQFMGTLDFMAPEVYDKRTSVENPMYTTKIDLFSLGESILNLMGFIKKAKPIDYNKCFELKNSNTLFNGNYDDQLLADLIFNNLLVPDPDYRASWELYFLHPFFEKTS